LRSTLPEQLYLLTRISVLLTRHLVHLHSGIDAQFSMPLRLMVTGQLQTSAIGVVLKLFGREAVVTRLQPYLQ